VSHRPVRVLSTRPLAQAERLLLPLRDAGYEAENIPLLAIEPLELEPVQRQCLLDLDQFHKVVVISPSAAATLLDQLEDYWPQWPVGVDWFTVGAGTHDALLQAGISARYPKTGDKSEDLLLLPELQQLAGEKLLLVKGVGGRSVLEEILVGRGARVTPLPIYARVKPRLQLQQIESLLQGDFAVRIITSAESLLQYAEFAATPDFNAGLVHEQWLEQPLLVPSYRIEQQAKSMGFRKVFNSDGAGADAIIKLLRREFPAA
jgi:uroporphyrinogen-III synthase